MSNSLNLNHQSDVDKIASCHSDNDVLLQQLYQRSERYQKQLKDNWYQRWLYICHSTEIPQSGDFLAVNVGDFPLIIVRNQHNKINALNNSCRHRGSRVCQEEKGNSVNLVCPYHQWTYDLEGKLTYARNMMDEIDTSALPLKSFACRVIDGCVYVCLDKDSSADIPPYQPLNGRSQPGRIAYEVSFVCDDNYETTLAQLNMATDLSGQDEQTTANACFFREGENHLIARVLPISEKQTHVQVSYVVSSVAVPEQDFSRQHFIDALQDHLSKPFEMTDIREVCLEPIPVTLNDLISSMVEQDDSAERQASCHTDNTILQQQIFQRSERYQQQLKNNWYPRWVYLGQATEIPHSGDFFAKNIGDYPLIVVRNQNDEVNVLNNSCRHRGSRVCQEEKGNSVNLVCPYHQWTYDLNGQLTYARNMMEEIDVSALPLKSFVHSIINDSIYVNLSLPADSEEQAPHEHLTVKNRHRAAYQYRVLCQAGYETVLSLLNLSTELLDTEEEASANVRFYHNPETDGIIAAGVIPVDEKNCELTLTYLVTSGTSEGKHFSREDFVRQAADELHITLINDNIEPLSVKPVRPVSPEDLPAFNARQVQDILEQRQAIDHADVYAPYRMWDASKQDLVCTMIVKETHNVRTYTFQTADGSWFNYKPGQFITLELPTEGEKTMRTYTLVSSPSRPMSIAITIKAQPNSTGTQWIFDNVNVGDSLKAYGPNGDFTFFNDPADKYLFISAGSGITPMMSMTRWLYDYGGNMDINFISCIASPDDILYQSELERMAERSRDIQLSWVCENDNELNTWTGYRGRFNKLILGLAASDYMDRDVYCCGPAPFMKAVREALDASGYDMSRYHEESFAGPEASTLPDDFPTEGNVVNVSFSKSDKQHECDQRETLLAAAKTANIAIPSACGFGVCGTCKVKINKGEIHMVHSGGISQKDIDSGYVLACCTHPMSDVEVEI